MNICIVNFSGRRSGNCSKISQIIKHKLSSNNNIVLKEMVDLNIYPCGKCDYSCFEADKSCPYFNDDIIGIYDSICSSNISYYIVPNYCDYPNSNFYIFNERSQYYFQNQPNLLKQYLQVKKKFIIVSNTEKSNFIQAFKYHILENDEVDALFLAANEFGQSSIEGKLMVCEQARHLVESYVDNLIPNLSPPI